VSDTDRRDTIDAQSDDLLGALRARERNLALSLRTACPALVVSYQAATQTVTVLVGALTVEDRGVPIPIPDPPLQITNVPVAFPRAMAGAAYDTWPIVPNDTGMLICCDRSLGEWRRLGVPADPVSNHTHSLGDAVFFPGPARPDAAVITPPPSLTARVVEAPLINLGQGAINAVLRGTAAAGSITALRAVLAGITPATETDPASVVVTANACRIAILALCDAITNNLSTRVFTV